MKIYSRTIPYLLFIAIIFSLPPVVSSAATESGYYNPLDIGLEVGVRSGYIENLLTDSTGLEDSYTSTTAQLKIYPISRMQVILYGDYTYYGKLYELSSLLKGIGTTYIPTRRESSFSAYFSANFNGRTYREDFQSFDNNNLDLMGTLGYRLMPTLFFRTGMAYRNTAYLYSETADKESLEFFAGINFILFGFNSFDIEGGLTRMDFSFIPDTTGRLRIGPPDNMIYEDYHVKGHLNSYYVSPRFSRPLGSKTGLSLTFHHRKFTNGDDAVVIGSALNFISPWANVYEGQSYSINIKTRLIPKMTISTGFTYWKKTFLKTHENDNIPVYYDVKRRDEQNRIYLYLERPIRLKTGSILKPSLTIEHNHNNSTGVVFFDLYDYSGITISGGITYQF